jgi:DNA mismatch repair protein MutS
MAGLPDSVIKRAYSIMEKLEEQRSKTSELKDNNQLSFFDLKQTSKEDSLQNKFEFIDELTDIDLDELSPLEALNRLYKWKKEVKKIEP